MELKRENKYLTKDLDFSPQISPSTEKKHNLTFFELKNNNILKDQKKEFFSLANQTINGLAENSTYYTSASPKKKEPRNIQLRKEENMLTKTNSFSYSSSSFKNPNFISQKLYNIEKKLKGYLKESHKFFKTKSIDQFLEKSELKNNQNLINIPEFEKFNNLCLNSNKSFKAETQIIYRNSINKELISISNSGCLIERGNESENSYLNFLNNNNNYFNGLVSNKSKNPNRNITSENEKSYLSSINFNTFNKNINLGMNNSNGTIPSIFKNFFEEKELKDLNKKRHSMAVGGLVHKDTLKNNHFSECEFKQKYQSNNNTIGNSITKLNFFLDKNSNISNGINSRISDFSLDININDQNNSNCNMVIDDSGVTRHSIKILKRNSILKDRLSFKNNNSYMNNFGVVEEEKFAFQSNSNDEGSSEEEN